MTPSAAKAGFIAKDLRTACRPYPSENFIFRQALKSCPDTKQEFSADYEAVP